MKYIIPIVFFFVTILTQSCCRCDDVKQEFTEEEEAWIPDGELGDSIVFTNGDSLTKTFFVEFKDKGYMIEMCAGPGCCICEEDHALISNYRIGGEIIPGTMVTEGFTINIDKSNYNFTKTFGWSCIYNKFQEFDYTLDTLIVKGVLYNTVHVKETNDCNIRKIYFVKKIGLIKFELEDGVWERMN